jgi:hypothetical protein
MFRLGLERKLQKEASFAKPTVEQNVRMGAIFCRRLARQEVPARDRIGREDWLQSRTASPGPLKQPHPRSMIAMH